MQFPLSSPYLKYVIHLALQNSATVISDTAFNIGYYSRFDEWAKTYGPMYSIKVATQTMIVITDRRLVKELMDKRGAISGNRPASVIVEKYIYEGDSFLLMNTDNPKWKLGRKLIHQYFMSSVVEKQHVELIEAEAVQLLHDMTETPNDFVSHLSRFANSLIMSLGKTSLHQVKQRLY